MDKKFEVFINDKSEDILERTLSTFGYRSTRGKIIYSSDCQLACFYNSSLNIVFFYSNLTTFTTTDTNKSYSKVTIPLIRILPKLHQFGAQICTLTVNKAPHRPAF
jgi:hypothetical protein